MSYIGPQNKGKEEDKGMGLRRFECEGFRHIKVECPTFLKKQKKGMNVTWSDSKNENEDETANTLITFTSKCMYECESSNNDVNRKDLET